MYKKGNLTRLPFFANENSIELLFTTFVQGFFDYLDLIL